MAAGIASLSISEPLASKLGIQLRQSRDIAAGPRQARDMADADWIGMCGEDDGIVFVACFAGSTSVELPAKIMSTRISISSVAN